MPRHPNQQNYIADGFLLDCDELIYKCTQGGSVNYHVFCNIWKDMKFYHIFTARPKGAELGELSEEVIHVAKLCMVGKSKNIEESIVGLFLVYALINLQPYKRFAHLRLLAEDIEALRNIEGVARRDQRIDVLYILGSVLIKGPVRYVASPREYGMELCIRKYTGGHVSIDVSSAGKGIFFRNREDLDLIRELNSVSKKYVEAKNMLKKTRKWNDNLNYTNNNLAVELEYSLKNLITGCNELTDEENDEDFLKICPKRDARSIKEKAMAGAVNPMRHLVAVSDKESPTKKQVHPHNEADFKVPAGYKKCNRILNKRTKGTKPRKVRYLNGMCDDNTDDIDALEDDLDDEAAPNDDPDTLDDEVNTDEQEFYIEIDTLPVISRVNENGKEIEIEVIDNYKEHSKVNVTSESRRQKSQCEDEVLSPPKTVPRKGKEKQILAGTSKDVNKKKLGKKSLPSIEPNIKNEALLKKETFITEPSTSKGVKKKLTKKSLPNIETNVKSEAPLKKETFTAEPSTSKGVKKKLTEKSSTSIETNIESKASLEKQTLKTEPGTSKVLKKKPTKKSLPSIEMDIDSQAPLKNQTPIAEPSTRKDVKKKASKKSLPSIEMDIDS